MVVDHITSHKFSIPFYTIVERWICHLSFFNMIQPSQTIRHIKINNKKNGTIILVPLFMKIPIELF